MAERIDGYLVRVPFESLKRTARSRKALLERLSSTIASAREGAAGPGGDRAATLDALRRALTEARALRKRARETAAEERADLTRLDSRLRHLAGPGALPLPREGRAAAARPRLDRLLVDWALRRGAPTAAALIAREGADEGEGGEGGGRREGRGERAGEGAREGRGEEEREEWDGSRGPEATGPGGSGGRAVPGEGVPLALADAGIFTDADEAVRGLRARDAGPALRWCERHAARLRRARSALPLRLRTLECLELVAAGDARGAVAHARRHLAPQLRGPGASPAHLDAASRVAAAIALGPGATAPRYAELYAPSRWVAAEEELRAELCRLHGLPAVAPLGAHLLAGLTALKSPAGMRDPCVCDDPLSVPELRELARYLPYAKHATSELICAISRRPMDDRDPPLALPNGYVYSTSALRRMAAANGGIVTCPRTGMTCRFQDLMRLYVF